MQFESGSTVAVKIPALRIPSAKSVAAKLPASGPARDESCACAVSMSSGGFPGVQRGW